MVVVGAMMVMVLALKSSVLVFRLFQVETSYHAGERAGRGVRPGGSHSFEKKKSPLRVARCGEHSSGGGVVSNKENLSF